MSSLKIPVVSTKIVLETCLKKDEDKEIETTNGLMILLAINVPRVCSVVLLVFSRICLNKTLIKWDIYPCMMNQYNTVSNIINVCFGEFPFGSFYFSSSPSIITSPQKYAMLILPTEFFQAEMTSAICHTVLTLGSKANYRENKYLSYRLAKYLC